VDDEMMELIGRLTTAAGIIMEDSSPGALRRHRGTYSDVDAALTQLEHATQDASILIQAARVVARRAMASS
jgi:hypothetical protein